MSYPLNIRANEDDDIEDSTGAYSPSANTIIDMERPECLRCPCYDGGGPGCQSICTSANTPWLDRTETYKYELCLDLEGESCPTGNNWLSASNFAPRHLFRILEVDLIKSNNWQKDNTQVKGSALWGLDLNNHPTVFIDTCDGVRHPRRLP